MKEVVVVVVETNLDQNLEVKTLNIVFIARKKGARCLNVIS